MTSFHPRKRAAAATAFGRIQDPRGIDPLLNLMKDPSAPVRKTAAFALGQLGWQSAFASGREGEIIQALKPLLSDGNSSVRAATLEALGKLALKDTPSLVTASLKDPSSEVRAQASMALYRYRLVATLKNPEATLETAVERLPPETLETLLTQSYDGNALVRRNMIHYFGEVKDPIQSI